MRTSPARNVRTAENIFWQSMERTVSFWSARTGSAATGRPFPGPPTPAAPNCHKKMEMIVKGEEETFVCSTCGYKEKLSAFKKRREKEGAGVNKRDVARYLNQQKKEAEEPINNAFAAALSGLKLDK